MVIYMCTFGLMPYFKKKTLFEISKQRLYVMLFDENLNQSDIHVRLWDGPGVKTKYIGSEFTGHSTAQDIRCNDGFAFRDGSRSNLSGRS